MRNVQTTSATSREDEDVFLEKICCDIISSHLYPSPWPSQTVDKESSKPYSEATNTKKIPKNHTKRPMNPFMIFSQHIRKQVISIHPVVNNAVLSRKLGRFWRTHLTKEQQKMYSAEFERLTALHRSENPEYKYRPRKRQRKTTDASSNPIAAPKSIDTAIVYQLKTEHGGQQSPRSGTCGKPPPVEAGIPSVHGGAYNPGIDEPDGSPGIGEIKTDAQFTPTYDPYVLREASPVTKRETDSGAVYDLGRYDFIPLPTVKNDFSPAAVDHEKRQFSYTGCDAFDSHFLGPAIATTEPLTDLAEVCGPDLGAYLDNGGVANNNNYYPPQHYYNSSSSVYNSSSASYAYAASASLYAPRLSERVNCSAAELCSPPPHHDVYSPPGSIMSTGLPTHRDTHFTPSLNPYRLQS